MRTDIYYEDIIIFRNFAGAFKYAYCNKRAHLVKEVTDV